MLVNMVNEEISILNQINLQRIGMLLLQVKLVCEASNSVNNDCSKEKMYKYIT